MSMQSIQNSIAEINAEKVFAAPVDTSSTTATLDLSTIDNPLLPGSFLAGGRVQPLLVLQADQDFYYAFDTADNLTLKLPAAASAGDHPVGTFVRAGDQEYVRPLAQTNRTWLYVIRASVDGTVGVFVSKSAA